jgi:hypothetical protein
MSRLSWLKATTIVIVDNGTQYFPLDDFLYTPARPEPPGKRSAEDGSIIASIT